jgi:chorismate-pyruvate lyase
MMYDNIDWEYLYHFPGSMTHALEKMGCVEVEVLEEKAYWPDHSTLSLNVMPEWQHTEIFRRGVIISLNGDAVIIACSDIRADCPIWFPLVKGRGKCPLGHTLFAPESQCIRKPLVYSCGQLSDLWPVSASCTEKVLNDNKKVYYSVRQSIFVLESQNLVLSELFLKRKVN